MTQLREDAIRTISNRLYGLAAGLYLFSLLLRSVLLDLVYLPGLETFSRPLAGFLQFLVTELSGLVTPWTATLCLIAAFILRPTLTSILAREDHH